MITSPLSRSLRVQMVRQGLPGRAEGPSGTSTPLQVDFGDGALQITPERPTPPAQFLLVFGDGSLTITP